MSYIKKLKKCDFFKQKTPDFSEHFGVFKQFSTKNRPEKRGGTNKKNNKHGKIKQADFRLFPCKYTNFPPTRSQC